MAYPVSSSTSYHLKLGVKEAVGTASTAYTILALGESVLLNKIDVYVYVLFCYKYGPSASYV